MIFDVQESLVGSAMNIAKPTPVNRATLLVLSAGGLLAVTSPIAATPLNMTPGDLMKTAPARIEAVRVRRYYRPRYYGYEPRAAAEYGGCDRYDCGARGPYFGYYGPSLDEYYRGRYYGWYYGGPPYWAF